jgi:hypothetical protein
MSIEEFLEYHKESIQNLVESSDWREDEVTNFLKDAWEAGYEFKIQEEELNKGASF